MQAQSPCSFMYQGVVRDNGLVCNRTVAVSISILQHSATGPVAYTTATTATTNDYGLYSVVIGQDDDLLALIDWADGPYFVKAAVDPSGGSNYYLVSVEQIRIVPLAQNVWVADSLLGGVVHVEKDPLFSAWNKSYNDLVNTPVNVSAFANDAGYLTAITETQILSIGHDTIFLSGGSFVVLPPGFDGDYRNLTNTPTRVSDFANDAGYLSSYTEVQALSISHDTVFLTGGSFVILPVAVEQQDLANVVGFGNSAAGRQLKSLQNPTDSQDVATRYALDSLLLTLTGDTIGCGEHNIYYVDTCDYYVWQGDYFTVSGIYSHRRLGVGNFLATDTLHLNLRHRTVNNATVTATDSYVWHNLTLDTSGIYYYTYLNNVGCPSTDTLHLTINAYTPPPCTHTRAYTDTLSVQACNRLKWYGQVISSSGIYSQALGKIALGGCDSVVEVQVTIHHAFRSDTAIRSQAPISWRGHTYSVQGDYGDTLGDIYGCDSIYTLHFMMGGNDGIGGAPGLYSLAPGLQVIFAHGNLYLNSAWNVWTFAPEQYDYENIPCVFSYYPTTSDIFPWATAGYHNPADTLNTFYHPWNHSNASHPYGSYEYFQNQYGYGPSSYMPDTNLLASAASYDWGVYNPVLNGGDGAGLWRTPSQEEWTYLLEGRDNAANLWSFGRICTTSSPYGGCQYTDGLIILSDDWVPLSGLPFVPGQLNHSANSYSLSQWRQLESSGAVFLPLPNGVTNYWSSTSGGSGRAFCLSLSSSGFMVQPYNRSNSNFVRLVQNRVAGASECKCTHFDTTVVAAPPFVLNGQSYSSTGEYFQVLQNQQGCDSILSLSLIVFDSGVLNGRFSVSPTHQVRFSRGNLQYKASNNVWRFAPVQYECIGEANKYISDTNDGWIDLFGWATSGYHDPTDVNNTQYHPWASDYGSYGPSVNMSDWNLVGTSANYDWGVYDTIPNGGNQPRGWRTLSYDEWNYLLNGRSGAMTKRGVAIVNGVNGWIFLPDLWTAPAGLLFDPNATNLYEGTDWVNMEAAGAVFLPCAGNRSGTGVGDVGKKCYYWTSSSKEGLAQSPYFLYDLYAFPDYYIYVRNSSGDAGYSVRLVKD